MFDNFYRHGIVFGLNYPYCSLYCTLSDIFGNRCYNFDNFSDIEVCVEQKYLFVKTHFDWHKGPQKQKLSCRQFDRFVKIPRHTIFLIRLVQSYE